MRIGLIAPVFLPLISGASFYCYELARALAALGHEVHIFTPKDGQDDPVYTLHPILKCRLPDDIEPLLSYDMDIWHSLYFVYSPLALFTDKPVFLTVHGDDAFSFFVRYRLPLRQKLTQWLLWRLKPQWQNTLNQGLNAVERLYDKHLANRALAKVKQIVTVSSFTQARVESGYNNAGHRITVIPPGIAPMYFDLPLTETKRHSGPFNLLTVTRLDDGYRIKNVHGVISALGLLKEHYDFHYTIISGTVLGNYRSELQQQVEELGLQDRVTFTGRLSDADLVRQYQNSDLFVLASYAEPGNFEGFGIVFLEANASGVPVLTTRSGGMADYVVDGENGLYADDPSPAAISRALQRFFDGTVGFNPVTLRSFAEPYRWLNIASRMQSLYETHCCT